MSKKKKYIYSLLTSIGMLFFSYWVTNLHFPISGEKEVISVFEAIRGLVYNPTDTIDSHVILIDVDYDKQLVTKTNEFGKPLGDGYPVTDRSKLTRLLSSLKGKDYKYILLDIGFEQNEKTEYDSALYRLISEMDRIVIPCDSLDALPDTCLYKKAALGYYEITPIESDFVKYPYFGNVKDTILNSMPLKLYEEITNRRVQNKWFFYNESWKLARSSIVLKLNYLPAKSKWLKLESDLLYGDEIDRLPIKDKYIVIGSCANDEHATYRGLVSGAIINFNAYMALISGHHIVSPFLIIILFISFFVFSYLILSRKTLKESLEQSGLHKNKWIRIIQRLLVLLCSWIGFSLYLSILCILTYVLLDEVYDIFITSTVFSFINLIVKLKLST